MSARTACACCGQDLPPALSAGQRAARRYCARCRRIRNAESTIRTGLLMLDRIEGPDVAPATRHVATGLRLLEEAHPRRRRAPR